MKALIFSILIGIMTSSASAFEWQSNCGAKYEKEWFKPNYSFHVKHGEVGGCRSDHLEQNYPGYGSWKWSERAEVQSKARLGPGKYEWSATIHIDRACEKPALRNTLFQIHAGGYLVTPPSWIGIESNNRFRLTRSGQTYGKVPKEPFELLADIHIERTKVKVDYYVNGKYLATNYHFNDKPYEKIFLKFGIYRVNSHCDITQSYKDVKFRKK